MLKFNKLFLLFFIVVGLGSAQRANAQTISSTLDNKKGVVEKRWMEFTASVTEGTANGQIINERLMLDDASQASEISVEYKDGSGNWNALSFTTGGIIWFGPASGFPLKDATTTFRVRFDKDTTYAYNLEIVDASTSAVLVSTDEEVSVNAYEMATVASTLNKKNVQLNEWTEYDVTTTAGTDSNTLVRAMFMLDDTSQAADIMVEYKDASNNWQSLPFTNGMIEFGPSTGFPLRNAASNFRVMFSNTGIYSYTINITDAATDTLIASASEFVEVIDTIVIVKPTISSTLNNMSGLIATKEASFDVTTTSGDFENTLVRGYLTLMDANQAKDITVSYFDGANWMPLTFNNGIIEFGPSTGFPLMDATSNFRITFANAGSFNYMLDIVDASTGDTLATTNETVNVDPFVEPVIESTLDNKTGVVASQEVTFTINTVAGTEANRVVKARLILKDTLQAPYINASYFDGSNWIALNIVGGVAEFGPQTGFVLTDTVANFRITFDTAGTFGYTLQLVDVNTNEIIASKDEEVTVNAPVIVIAPTISSTLNNMSNIVEDREVSFSVSTTAGSDENTIVKGYMTLQDISQASDISLSYFDGTNWMPLTFNNGVIEFGPATGFPLMDATSNFRVTFASSGIYNYTLDIVEVATGDTLTTAKERVIVADFVVPTIVSTLNNRTGVVINNQITFDVKTTAGTDVNRMVKARLVLDDASQASNITASYFDGTNWMPLTFTNGVVEFGPATGFPLTNATSNFRITFGAAGTYAYTLELTDATTNEVLASANEQVVVNAVIVMPKLSSTLNNKTGIIANRQTTFTVTPDPGTETGRMVRLYWIFDDIARGQEVTAEYMDANGDWQQISFINGIAQLNSAAGITLNNSPISVRATFLRDGIYAYNLEIRDVVNNLT
ncbi:MAG: hypothetical protein EOO07_06020 [Chitinophagaceae bacterium]|nr:MAG: hypothetical protein EOO07_06020 [Chitinophagaceae bacterium]